MKEPLISIYITNYNYERFIERSIESVFAQTLQDFELVIIDDGSTDNSKNIIERYRDEARVTIIYQQNKGLNITNNVAMRVSKGKYLMRLDADDFLVPTALADMSALLEAQDDLGLVFPDYYYVDATGQKTGEEKRHNFEKEVSLYDQPAHGACTMIRLSFLKQLGGYNESFTCQDGYDLWLKFITHFSVSNINKPLFYYRRHGENLTTNEERILSTRRAIKETFIAKEQSSASAIMVIPVRNSKVNKQSWPLFEHDDQTVLAHKVTQCLKANTCARVVVVSSDAEILSYAQNTFTEEERVLVVERPARFAGPNQTLNDTVRLAVDTVEQQGVAAKYVMTVALEYPFLQHPVLDDAVNTSILFNSDSVISVRPDNKSYYRHTGHTLTPILDQEKFTRLEREALYKAAGGVMMSTLDAFKEHGKINAGKVSHVVVDEATAFGVHSAFEFTLFQNLTKSSKAETV